MPHDGRDRSPSEAFLADQTRGDSGYAKGRARGDVGRVLIVRDGPARAGPLARGRGVCSLSRFGVLSGVLKYMEPGPDFSRASDAELLRRTATEPAAFRELYRRYERIVVAFLARRTGDAELTADLTAETFATALLHAGRFRSELGDSALGWLFGIARHAWLHGLERRRTERSACQRLGMQLSIGEASLERVDAFIDAEQPDNPLLALLAGLPPEQREAVRAHVLEERPYGELADELRVSPATLRQRVSRGLAHLRAAISEETP